METVSMAVYQHLLAMSVVQDSEIEGLKAGARTAQAEIGRLEAAAKYCEDNHCDVDEIEQLRAALLKEGIRSTERELAAFEEAAKALVAMRKDLDEACPGPPDMVAHDMELLTMAVEVIRKLAKEVQGE